MKNVLVRLYGIYLNVMAIVMPSRAAKTGFMLFCRPFRTPITHKQHEFFNSSEKFLIPYGKENIQAYRWGTGATKLLFLHGWQSHTYRWKAYIEALDHKKFTIYALDAPGHGLSSGNFLTVPVYSELIGKFIAQSGPFHAVVTHSLGGFSLLHTFHTSPKLAVDNLILLAPPGEATEFISVFKNTLGLSSRTVNLVTGYFSKKYNVGPDYFSTKRYVKELNVKGFIIHDEEDAEAPYHHAVYLHKNWPQSKLETTKGFGHNLRSPSVVKLVSSYIMENMVSTHVQSTSSLQEKR